MSSRVLKPCFRSSSGHLHISKTAGKTPYESGLERDYFIQASAHPDFLSLQWNPIEIHYVDSFGTWRTYTPDALVEHRIGSPMPKKLLVEIKYWAELRKDYVELRDRFYAARAYVQTMPGWKFEVRTEKSIDPVFVQNARLLNRYKDMPLENQDPDHPSLLINALRDRGGSTPDYLLAVCYSSVEDKARAIPYLWSMIANGIVGCDMGKTLTMSSHIWPIS